MDAISIGDSKILKIGNNGRVTQLVKDDNILYDGVKSGTLYVLDSDKNTIYSTDPRFTYIGNLQIKQIPYRPIEAESEQIHFLKEEDIRFYKANNFIRDSLGCGQEGEDLKQKIYSNLNDFISESEFNPGEKIFLCSDGIGDNLTQKDLREIFYTKRNARECLKSIVNKIYQLQREKQQKGTNNPNKYLEGHNQFNETLKGTADNSSGIVIENKGDER